MTTMDIDRLIIGFDAKRAANNSTGLGNYSRLVLRVLGDALPESQLRMYVPRLHAGNRLGDLCGRFGRRMPAVTPDTAAGRRLSALWRVRGITQQLRRDGVQLFHGLSNELPLNIRDAHIPTVVTIHDLIFRRLPHCYKPVDRAIYDYKFRRAAQNATRVIAISERTRDDIVELYGVSPDKIDVVYQGCDQQFSLPVSDADVMAVKRRYGIGFERYVIGVGTIERRKNQLLTARAMRGLPPDTGLVLVGRRTPYTAEIERFMARNGLAGRLRIVSDVSFADLPALYRGAAMASYPSRYEGFGLPVIEALSVGVPVVVAMGSCLEEAGGPGTPAVGPDDTDALVDVARRILDDPAVARGIVDAGRRHIERFAPGRFAEGILNTYNKALDNN